MFSFHLLGNLHFSKAKYLEFGSFSFEFSWSRCIVIERHLHILGEGEQVVVGNGRLPCTCGTHKHHGLFMGQVGLQEKDLAGCLRGLDNQVTDLQTKSHVLNDCSKINGGSNIKFKQVHVHTHTLHSDFLSHFLNTGNTHCKMDFFATSDVKFTDLGGGRDS